jgi:hypothetical protein
MSNAAADTNATISAADRGYRGPKWCRTDKRLAIYLRDGMACAYCGAGVEDGAILSLDHLLPNSKGGGNHEGNLVTCCHACNSKRGNMDLGQWLAVACGANAAKIAALITEHTGRNLAPFRAEAKAIIARRIVA